MKEDDLRELTFAALPLYRRIGKAEGILGGWLHWDGTVEHMEQLRKATRSFLEEGKP